MLSRNRLNGKRRGKKVAVNLVLRTLMVKTVQNKTLPGVLETWRHEVAMRNST